MSCRDNTLGHSMKQPTQYKPEALLAKYRKIREQITERDFFGSPRHQKTMEMWCAAHFARAYEQYIASCSVMVNDIDTQTDVDFELEIGGVSHPFQITEVMEPRRRRGDEYRNGAPALRRDDLEEGTRNGAAWVRAAIEKKAEKKYAAQASLNLLLYLNFAGRSQQYEVLRAGSHDMASQFASVWLLNGNTMCCIRPNSRIQAFEGWLVIDESRSGNDV